jgi:hypothetical protein
VNVGGEGGEQWDEKAILQLLKLSTVVLRGDAEGTLGKQAAEAGTGGTGAGMGLADDTASETKVVVEEEEEEVPALELKKKEQRPEEVSVGGHQVEQVVQADPLDPLDSVHESEGVTAAQEEEHGSASACTHVELQGTTSKFMGGYSLQQDLRFGGRPVYKHHNRPDFLYFVEKKKKKKKTARNGAGGGVTTGKWCVGACVGSVQQIGLYALDNAVEPSRITGVWHYWDEGSWCKAAGVRCTNTRAPLLVPDQGTVAASHVYG